MVLRKIKQFLGMGSEKRSQRADTDVVVQEEDAEPETESEAAVTDVEDSDGSSENEPIATDTEASASTESLVDDAGTQEEPEMAAEPAEAAGPDTDEEPSDIEEAEPDADDEAMDGTPVDDIKGIGPAYSERLGEVGINNVADLADADPAELAEKVTVAEKTVAKWVDRAKEYGN